MGFLAQGGDGVISVTANIVPKKIADLQNAWFSGDMTRALTIDNELTELNRALFLDSNPCPVKYAAYKLGLCDYELRLPLTKISLENEKLICKILDNLDVNFN